MQEYLAPHVVVIGGAGISEEVEKEIINKAHLEISPMVIRTNHFSRMSYVDFVGKC